MISKCQPGKKVAYSGKTYLALAMLEDPKKGKIMHQQSDAYVRKLFWENIKIAIRNNLTEEGDEGDKFSFSPVYSSEYVAERDKQEVRVMDGTHIRTNIKSKLIRSDFADIKVSAWKKSCLFR